jgi:hypothetical protein
MASAWWIVQTVSDSAHGRCYPKGVWCLAVPPSNDSFDPLEYLRASADIVKYAWVDAPNANVPSLGAVSEN